MSEEDLEIVRAAVDAVNRGDWVGAFADTGPGFEWDNSRAIGTDNREVFHSADEAREFYKQMTGFFESFRIEIDELIPVGDHVVVPHTTHLVGRDGIEVQGKTTWLFRIRDGKIERVCLYQETQEALNDATQ